MNTYQTDSRGKRIAWARKQAGYTGAQLARAIGVRNVTVSYIENDRRELSLPLLMKIAQVTGVTVGFLLMETEYPYRQDAPPEMEPAHLSPEADAAAELIDLAPPNERARMLAVLRTLASAPADDCVRDDCGSELNTQRRQFHSRLVHRDKVVQPQAGERARS